MLSRRSVLAAGGAVLTLSACDKEYNFTGKIKPPPPEDPVAGILPVDKREPQARMILDPNKIELGIMVSDRTVKVQNYLIEWQNKFITDSYALNNPPHPGNATDLLMSLVRRKFPKWTRVYNLNGVALGSFEYVAVVDLDIRVPEKPPGEGHAAAAIYFIDRNLAIANVARGSATIDVPAKLRDASDAYMPAVVASAVQVRQAMDTFIK